MTTPAPIAASQYSALRQGTAAVPGSGPGLQAARDFASTLQAGEEAAKTAIVADYDPHVFVTAMAQTELAVEAAVIVRDKVVEAYQEILRMPV
jgi:flagellar hook-basal body complex protein FliE